MQTFAAVCVTRHLLLPSVRFVDDRAQLFDRERRLRHEIALLVEPRAMRHVDLDPVGAVIELLARRFARFDRTIDQLRTFRHFDLRRITLEVVAAGRRNRARDDEHAWAGNLTFVDGLLDADVAVAGAFRFDVANRREALLERASRGNGGARGAIRERILQKLNVVSAFGRVFALKKDVRMCVDQSRQDGHGRQIDHTRVRRQRRGVVANADDAIAADHDGLIVFHVR